MGAGIGEGLLMPELSTTAQFQTVTNTTDIQNVSYYRGLWVELEGTEPRAHIRLSQALVADGAIRSYVGRRFAPYPF
jgi:hypothetical protein